jgi:hypothetical protein
MAIALICAGALHRRASAHSGCGIAFTSTDPHTYYANPIVMYNVLIVDKPVWLYINWGDGTYHYEEKEETGDVYFYPSHEFASSGPYYGNAVIGFWNSQGEYYDTCLEFNPVFSY